VTSGGQVVLKASTSSTGTIGPRVLPAMAGRVVPGTIRNVAGVGQVSGTQLSALSGSLKVAGSSPQTFISQVRYHFQC